MPIIEFFSTAAVMPSAVGAAIPAENGATSRQLMAIFGWSSLKMAELFARSADQNDELAGTEASSGPRCTGCSSIRLAGRPTKKSVTREFGGPKLHGHHEN
jgi:hypothetical protein